jgi:hypothetical protein
LGDSGKETPWELWFLGPERAKSGAHIQDGEGGN